MSDARAVPDERARTAGEALRSGACLAAIPAALGVVLAAGAALLGGSAATSVVLLTASLPLAAAWGAARAIERRSARPEASRARALARAAACGALGALGAVAAGAQGVHIAALLGGAAQPSGEVGVQAALDALARPGPSGAVLTIGAAWTVGAWLAVRGRSRVAQIGVAAGAGSAALTLAFALAGWGEGWIAGALLGAIVGVAVASLWLVADLIEGALLETLAARRLAAGDLEAWRAAMLAAAEVHPEGVAVLSRMSSTLLARGLLAEAEARSARAVALRRDRFTLAHLGYVKLACGRAAECVALLDEALAGLPPGLPLEPPWFRGTRARANLELGRFDFAAVELEHLLRRARRRQADPRWATGTLSDLGWARLATGRPAEAEAFLGEALERAAGKPWARDVLVAEAHRRRAVVRVVLGRLADAAADARAALELGFAPLPTELPALAPALRASAPSWADAALPPIEDARVRAHLLALAGEWRLAAGRAAEAREAFEGARQAGGEPWSAWALRRLRGE